MSVATVRAKNPGESMCWLAQEPNPLEDPGMHVTFRFPASYFFPSTLLTVLVDTRAGSIARHEYTVEDSLGRLRGSVYIYAHNRQLGLALTALARQHCNDSEAFLVVRKVLVTTGDLRRALFTEYPGDK